MRYCGLPREQVHASPQVLSTAVLTKKRGMREDITMAHPHGVTHRKEAQPEQNLRLQSPGNTMSLNLEPGCKGM